ncbi:TMAO reductase system periplasmic protein TorT [Chitinibacter sp. S2-10]|uniref:TMAO reductase system periplasmic protein TorT n=1 Tax=Chitinibacter sp. S2-10 TaxID=3373597 RepID=UPI003977C438
MRSLLLLTLFYSAIACADWFPIDVKADGKTLSYTPLNKARQAWRVCALLPQAKDRFWWGISWGLAQEADRQGIKLGIYQAGGYEQSDKQQRQFDDCLAQKADAIIVAATADATKALASRIAKAAANKIPVINLTNGLNLPQISAHILSNTEEMGQLAASHILSLAGNSAPTVAWLPGPNKTEWVSNAEIGVQKILAPPKAKLLHGGYGVTELETQMTLVRALLAKQQPDYLLANAVAADAASRLIKYGAQKKMPIIAYYSNEETINALRQGRIQAVVASQSVIEARISIDVAIRILENQPYAHIINPSAILLTQSQLDRFNIKHVLSPAQQWFVAKPLPK